MRELLNRIDSIGATGGHGTISAVLRDLLAASLASQALAAAAARGEKLTEENLRAWINATADAEGVLTTPIDHGGPVMRIGDRAEQIARHLLGMTVLA